MGVGDFRTGVVKPMIDELPLPKRTIIADAPADYLDTDRGYLNEGQRKLDAGTQGLINQQLERALAPPEEEQSRITEGTKEAGAGLLLDPSSSMINPQGGRLITGMNEALARRQQKDFDSVQRQLKRSAVLQGQINQADQGASASSALARSEQIRLANWQNRMNKLEQQKAIKAQEDAQRGSLIGNILGTAVSIGTFGLLK